MSTKQRGGSEEEEKIMDMVRKLAVSYPAPKGEASRFLAPPCPSSRVVGGAPRAPRATPALHALPIVGCCRPRKPPPRAFNALSVCSSVYALNLNPTIGIRKIGTSNI